MKSILNSLTPLFAVQAILSIVIVIAFVIQELTIHAVDTDLKILTFAVFGYWLGGIVEAKTGTLSRGVMSNGK